MKKIGYLFYSTIVFALDFLSKIIVTGWLPLGGEKKILPFFTIVHWQNRGGLWGFLSNSSEAITTVMFLIIPILGLLFVFYLFVTSDDKIELILLSLMIGGGLGNLIDRIINGAVTDFIYFHLPSGKWGYPAFNIADASLSTSLFLYICKIVLKKEKVNAPDSI